MDKLIAAAERTSSKLPFALRGSPVDPIVLVVVSPLIIIHVAAFAIANVL